MGDAGPAHFGFDGVDEDLIEQLVGYLGDELPVDGKAFWSVNNGGRVTCFGQRC